jgi:hypothetical protein
MTNTTRFLFFGVTGTFSSPSSSSDSVLGNSASGFSCLAPSLHSDFCVRNWIGRIRTLHFLLIRSARHRGLSETQNKNNQHKLKQFATPGAIFSLALPKDVGRWAAAD